MAGRVMFSGILLSLVWFAAAVPAFRSETETASLFEGWLSSNPRPYIGDLSEKNLRYEVFKSNLKNIDAHNAEESSYKMGLNSFADLTSKEFKSQYLGYVNTPKDFFSELDTPQPGNPFRYANVTPPAAIDWRELGAVTHIKNQGACGCCWAFAVIGGVEGIVKIKTKRLISLSEQELVSCNNVGFSCDGGGNEGAFEYIIENGGVDSERNYKYTSINGVTGNCTRRKAKRKVASIVGYEITPPNNETALKQAVANQPVSIGIDASLLQSYSSGILTGNVSDCNAGRDHAVVVIGYNTTASGQDYWIMKNSWGTSWGEGGFFRIERNIEDPQGLCLLATDCSYPTKD